MREKNSALARCAFIFPGEKIDAAAYDKIFIGSEVCGAFLSSEVFFNELKNYKLSGKKIGIAVPYLTPSREENFFALLSKLESATEIVVNDAGAFELTRRSGHVPVLGRLLARQQTDPAIPSFFDGQPERGVYDYEDYARLKYTKPPETLACHFLASPVFSQEASEIFLSGRGEMTVVMDRLPIGMPERIPEKFNVLLNLENILVSVIPCRSCRDCPKNETVLGKTRAGATIYWRRGLCYYKFSECPGANERPRLPDYVSGTIESI